MNILLIIISGLVISICIAYILIISAYTFGWFGLKNYRLSKNNFSTKVSVVIAARNEENNIINCLNALVGQDYQRELYEIIVVDDSSTDKTYELVKKFIYSNPTNKIDIIKLKYNKLTKAFKKEAISKAVAKSSGDLIITTDADCSMKEKWISTIVDFYETRQPKMIIAPVCLKNDKNIFKKFQSLEFLSLIASGAGAVNIGKPIMCNGANLAYQKKVFLEVDAYNSDNKYASGDDVFLLLKIIKKYGSKSVEFLKNYNALVFTEPQNTLRDFINQRLRWVSKSKGYKEISIIFVALIVYLFNFILLAGFIGGLFFKELLVFDLILFIIKNIIDLPILIGITAFMKRKKLLWYYFPLQIVYVFYVVIIGALGNILKYRWKGRELS